MRDRQVVDVGPGDFGDVSQVFAFCLGYEFAIVDQLAKSGDSFEMMCHIENTERIQARMRSLGRKYFCRFMADDKSEGWIHLTVAGKD